MRNPTVKELCEMRTASLKESNRLKVLHFDTTQRRHEMYKELSDLDRKIANIDIDINDISEQIESQI